jgi:hypothetical protein
MKNHHPAVHEDLATKGRRWRKAMSDAATGPLQIAKEVVALDESWPVYKKEADGKSLTGWLRLTLGRGRGLFFFKSRAYAVELLGPSVARTFHHEVAVWVANNVDKDSRESAVWALLRATQENGRVPLTIKQAQLVVGKLLGRRALPRASCPRCTQLEELLRKNGIRVPS